MFTLDPKLVYSKHGLTLFKLLNVFKNTFCNFQTTSLTRIAFLENANGGWTFCSHECGKKVTVTEKYIFFKTLVFGSRVKGKRKFSKTMTSRHLMLFFQVKCPSLLLQRFCVLKKIQQRVDEVFNKFSSEPSSS